jgi:hypothetical protein
MFRSLMTIITELYLYLNKVTFILKHSMKLSRYMNYVMWHLVVQRRVYCILCSTGKAPWWWSLKTETCRSYIIVYFNVNLKLLTKLINSAFVCVWTTQGNLIHCLHSYVSGCSWQHSYLAYKDLRFQIRARQEVFWYFCGLANWLQAHLCIISN